MTLFRRGLPNITGATVPTPQLFPNHPASAQEVKRSVQAEHGPAVRSIGAHDTVGDMALQSRRRRAATAIAVTPVATLVLHRSAYDAVLRTQQDADLGAKTALFRTCAPFAAATPRERAALAAVMAPEALPAGAALFREGSAPAGLALIRRGTVKLLRAAASSAGAASPRLFRACACTGSAGACKQMVLLLFLV